MKTVYTRKEISRPALLLSLISLLILLTTIYAEPSLSPGLPGPAFSDPDKQLQMPADWKETPIIHDSSFGRIDLAVNLDQQMYRILMPAAKKYAKTHHLHIAVTDSTCGNSAGMLRRKMIDIGGFCCPPAEIDRLPGLRFHTTGIAPVALLVHPENPIDDITLEEARKIFTGEIFYWSELQMPDGRPGPETMIRPIGRLHCKIRPGHWRLLLDNEDLFSPRMHEVGSISDMISEVASHPDAIGHETVWLATEHYQEKGRVKTLKINGHAPEDLNALLNGRYPIYKTFNITTWEGERLAKRNADGLVDYFNKQVEGLDPKYGIIPSDLLRKAGWKFQGNELIGEPGYSKQ
jgi:ABC-type phosphate transport system substrate-binding protein